jgi:hypothetical protein
LQRTSAGAPKKRRLPGGLRAPGDFDNGDRRPTDFGFLFKKFAEAFGYTPQQCADLTIPDIITLCADLGPTQAEPEWFVNAVRGARDYRKKFEFLIALTET